MVLENDLTNLSKVIDNETSVEGLADGATCPVNETTGPGPACHGSDIDPARCFFNSDGRFVATVSFDIGLR